MFRRMDDDGSKNLCYDEFRKGIEETGLELTEEGYKEMFVLFDKDGSGKVLAGDNSDGEGHKPMGRSDWSHSECCDVEFCGLSVNRHIDPANTRHIRLIQNRL